jgi:hypothetical protein
MSDNPARPADYVATMTPSQRVAYEHRCYLAGETVHPRFASVLPGNRYSLVLTVNTGYE